MISPLQETPIYAKDNINGYLSSILAWVGGSTQTSGQRTFQGFQVYDFDDWLLSLKLPAKCNIALTQVINCQDTLQTWTEPSWRGNLENTTLMDLVCDSGCGASLKSYFNTVETSCAGYNISGYPTTIPGGYIWEGYNQTCLKDTSTDRYCSDVTGTFSTVRTVQDMPKAELCNPCFVAQYAMLQSSQYSIYNTYYESILKYIYSTCGLSGPVGILPPLIVQEVPTTFCASGNFYTTSSGDTCDTIAQAYNVSSSALYRGNQNTTKELDCFNITPGSVLCIPIPCSFVYTVQETDTCDSIEAAYHLENGAVRDLNPFIVFGCLNLHISNAIYGNTICLSPQGGTFQPGIPLGNSTTVPVPITGYSLLKVAPPTEAKVAAGTTLNCGKWYTALVGDDCASINVRNGITAELFLTVNPSLKTTDCTASLIAGTTYCVGPTYDWDVTLTSSGTTGPTSVSSTATTITAPTTSHTTITTSSTTSPTVTIISSTTYPAAPAQTSTGTTPQCKSWYTVKNGDTCDTISSTYGISRSQLVI
ncbi:hypothetical protein V502_03132 [Pseudogymnoascus sp. VKM F-4520 (FW-2644)]|nr:hypothetical protein V502_03132 [Pseudogymnoascus sp. VKM F-4520 (FW-2644)]